jgi:hypothetical protein
VGTDEAAEPVQLRLEPPAAAGRKQAGAGEHRFGKTQQKPQTLLAGFREVFRRFVSAELALGATRAIDHEPRSRSLPGTRPTSGGRNVAPSLTVTTSSRKMRSDDAVCRFDLETGEKERLSPTINDWLRLLIEVHRGP